MELKGSYCYEGVKGDKKAVYTIRFKTEAEAKAHILSKFTDTQVIENFWYGYHINEVNKVAKMEGTASDGYDKAELLLMESFPQVTFVRNIEKVKALSAELQEIDKLVKGKGMSLAQVKELLQAHTPEQEK